MTASNDFPDVRDLATEFHCSLSTIWRRVADGTFPKPIKIGGLTRWVRPEIDAVIDRAKRDRDEAEAAINAKLAERGGNPTPEAA